MTELELIAGIKPGLVNVAEPIAYSARLRQLFGALFRLRSLNAETADSMPLTGALERLRRLHFFNWSLFDHDRRLLLTVSFDGPWEPYIRQIVEVAGPLLDIIFCHCEDYKGSSCLDGYAAFSQWVRDHQVEQSLMYSAAPDLTVDDLRYLRQFEPVALEGKSSRDESASHAPRPPNQNDTSASNRALFEALEALLPLRRLFADNRTRDSHDDLFLFDRAVEFLTRHLRPAAERALGPGRTSPQSIEASADPSNSLRRSTGEKDQAAPNGADPAQRRARADKMIRALLDEVPIDFAIDRLIAFTIKENLNDHVLDMLALKGERAKPRIERTSGPSWSTEEVGRLVGKSAETVRSYIARNRLVGYTALGDQTRLRLPCWQFNEDSQVLPWVAELLDAFGENGWPLLDFVTVARDHLGGDNYLHLLLSGRAEEVLAAAKRANPD